MSNFEKLYQETLRSLEEALGIPNNVIEEAQRVYEEFLKLLENADGSKIVYEQFAENFELVLGKETYRDLK